MPSLDRLQNGLSNAGKQSQQSGRAMVLSGGSAAAAAAEADAAAPFLQTENADVREDFQQQPRLQQPGQFVERVKKLLSQIHGG